MYRNYLIITFAIFFGNRVIAQTGNIGIGTRTPNPKSILDITSNDKGILIPRLSSGDRDKIAIDGQDQPDINGMLIYNTDKNEFNFWNLNKWIAIPKTASGAISFYGNRPITADYFTGFNPGTDDLAKWVENVFYPSQGPIADLSISYNNTTANNILLEHTGDNNPMQIGLNWTAGRKKVSANIATVVVGGVPQKFTNPDPGATINGVQLIDQPANTDASYQNVVTTADKKSALATAYVKFAWKIYWGFINGPANGVLMVPKNNEILSLSQELSSTKNMIKSIAPNGSQRVIIAIPEIYESGGSKIMINQMDQTGAFDRIVQQVKNKFGATINYVLYISKNNTNGNLTFELQ
ncbi:MAG: hypothetical protein NVS3B19_07830 [Ginsengibacter sp.]